MHTIKLDDKQLNIVAAALAKLPYEVVAPVFAAIDAQLLDAKQASTTETPQEQTSQTHPHQSNKRKARNYSADR